MMPRKILLKCLMMYILLLLNISTASTSIDLSANAPVNVSDKIMNAPLIYENTLITNSSIFVGGYVYTERTGNTFVEYISKNKFKYNETSVVKSFASTKNGIVVPDYYYVDYYNDDLLLDLAYTENDTSLAWINAEVEFNSTNDITEVTDLKGTDATHYSLKLLFE